MERTGKSSLLDVLSVLDIGSLAQGKEKRCVIVTSQDLPSTQLQFRSQARVVYDPGLDV